MDLGAQVIDFFSYIFGNILLAPPENFELNSYRMGRGWVVRDARAGRGVEVWGTSGRLGGGEVWGEGSGVGGADMLRGEVLPRPIHPPVISHFPPASSYAGNPPSPKLYPKALLFAPHLLYFCGTILGIMGLVLKNEKTCLQYGP